MNNYEPAWEKDRREGLSHAPAPEVNTSAVYSDSYKICSAIRALQAVGTLHCEGGTIERMERDLLNRAKTLGIDVTTLWNKFDQFGLAQRRANVKLRIEAGHFDGDVVARSGRIKSMTEAQTPANKHYPFHGKPGPKRNVASITIHNGKVESVIFNLDHGLINGVYALQVAP